jgi:hypothetical protein
MRLPGATSRRWMIGAVVVSLLVGTGVRLGQRREYSLAGM